MTRYKTAISVTAALALPFTIAVCSVASKDAGAVAADPAQRAYERAQWIFDHATETHYQHLRRPAAQQVILTGSDTCVADADCSGFVSFILRDTAPKQYQVIHSLQPDHDYPQAKVYAAFFHSLPAGSSRSGWRRIMRLQEVQKGDFVAWEKPVDSQTANKKKKGNTGHVAIVEAPPASPDTETIEGKAYKYIELQVLDCSSVDHFKPEQLPPNTHQDHRNGLGKGTIKLILDDSDKICGYWEGTYSNESKKAINHPTYTGMVEFARLESGK